MPLAVRENRNLSPAIGLPTLLRLEVARDRMGSQMDTQNLTIYTFSAPQAE